MNCTDNNYQLLKKNWKDLKSNDFKRETFYHKGGKKKLKEFILNDKDKLDCISTLNLHTFKIHMGFSNNSVHPIIQVNDNYITSFIEVDDSPLSRNWRNYFPEPNKANEELANLFFGTNSLKKYIQNQPYQTTNKQENETHDVLDFGPNLDFINSFKSPLLKTETLNLSINEADRNLNTQNIPTQDHGQLFLRALNYYSRNLPEWQAMEFLYRGYLNKDPNLFNLFRTSSSDDLPQDCASDKVCYYNYQNKIDDIEKYLRQKQPIVISLGIHHKDNRTHLPDTPLGTWVLDFDGELINPTSLFYEGDGYYEYSCPCPPFCGSVCG